MNRRQAIVIYDGDCGLCTRVRDVSRALDWFQSMRWIPQQDPEAAQYGIAANELRDAMFIVTGRGASRGWSAVRRIALRLPLTYLLAAEAIRKSPWTAIGVALVLSPLLNPAGNRGYAWVARNRYRLPGSSCAVPVWDNRNE